MSTSPFSGHPFELSSYNSFNLSLCCINTGILLFLEPNTSVPTSETWLLPFPAIPYAFPSDICMANCLFLLRSLPNCSFIILLYMYICIWHLLLLEIISCIIFYLLNVSPIEYHIHEC